MNLCLVPEAHAVVRQSIFLTGSMRSGTTMMARLLASLEDTEMFIEPSSIYLLMPMITELETKHWKIIFECILYEDYLVPALAGRNLNFNSNDLTYVGGYMAKDVIDKRLSTAHKHSSLVNRTRETSISIKLPEMMPYVEKLRTYYPHMKYVAMLRRPESCIVSMLNKGWYSDEGLHGKTNKWPVKNELGKNFPFWLPDDKHNQWCSMSEIERCCYSYYFQYRSIKPNKFNLIVDYDKMVIDPSSIFALIVEKLGLKYGKLTNDLLAGVSEPDIERTMDWEQIDSRLKEKVFSTYEYWCRAT